MGWRWRWSWWTLYQPVTCLSSSTLTLRTTLCAVWTSRCTCAIHSLALPHYHHLLKVRCSPFSLFTFLILQRITNFLSSLFQLEWFVRPQLSMEPGGERRSSPSTKIQPKWKSDMLIMEATTESRLTPFDRSGLLTPPLFHSFLFFTSPFCHLLYSEMFVHK